MLIAGSALKGYTLDTRDGPMGTVKTLLLDDTTWKVRWVVVDTGYWLPGRQVLVHPSAIGRPDYERQLLPVSLSRAQVEASPDISQDQPVTMQMQDRVYDYYGWDRAWGGAFYGPGMVGFDPIGTSWLAREPDAGFLEADTMQSGSDHGDAHLRSMAAITGYHIQATDGSIGHVENFLLDDVTWTIRYLIVDTRNWWPGAHVLISPYAVRSIDWGDGQVHLDVSRQQVKASPPWDPLDIVEQPYEQRLHEHYGWPGHGW